MLPPSIFRLGYVDTIVLQNVGMLLHHFMASQTIEDNNLNFHILFYSNNCNAQHKEYFVSSS